jgi:hypothetical protein
MSRPEDTACYLPLDLKTRAQKAGINFSRLLRRAVEQELNRRDQLQGADVHEVDVVDDGQDFKVRIHGTLLFRSEHDGRAIFLTDDDQVIGYETSTMRLTRIDDPAQELRRWLGRRDYTDIMRRLGLAPIVDIGRGGDSGFLRGLVSGAPRRSGG